MDLNEDNNKSPQGDNSNSGNQNKRNGLGFIPKMILLALVVLIGLIAFIYGQVHKYMHDHSPATKIEKLKEEKDKLKDKFHEKYGNKFSKQAIEQRLADHEEKKQQEQLQTQNQLHAVNNTQFVNANQLATSQNDSDTPMLFAIKNGDLQRVNFLMQSGIKIGFNNDSLCMINDPTMPITDPARQQFGGKTLALPKTAADMETFLLKTEYVNDVATSMNYPFTTSCVRNFVYTATLNLDKTKTQGDPLKYYNYNLYKVSQTGQLTPDLQNQAYRDNILNALVSATPKEDYDTLPIMILNDKIPYDTRKDLLNKYIDYVQNKDTVAIDTNKKAFLDMYSQALNDIVKTQPTERFSNLNDSLHYMPSILFQNITIELAKRIHAYNDFVRPRLNYFTTDKPIEITSDVIHNGLMFDVDPNSGYYKGLNSEGYKTLYELQQSIIMYNLLLNSKVVNIDYQDFKGQSILHLLAKSDGAAAPIIRDLLKRGANANLLTKSGASPLSIAMNISNASSQRANSITQNQNAIVQAFTDKTETNTMK